MWSEAKRIVAFVGFGVFCAALLAKACDLGPPTQSLTPDERRQREHGQKVERATSTYFKAETDLMGLLDYDIRGASYAEISRVYIQQFSRQWLQANCAP